MKNDIINQVTSIVKRNLHGKFEDAQDILLKYLIDNPKDTEAWLLALRIECNPPLYDPFSIIDYVNKILSYDPHNSKAILFLAYGRHYLIGYIDNNTYEKLNTIQDKDLEIMAMVEVAKARYFEINNIVKYETHLKQSIAYSKHQSTNYIMLSKLYFSQKKQAEGSLLLKKGIANIKKIYSSENMQNYDPLSIEGFFDTHYKGTSIMDWQYNDLILLVKNNE